MKATDNPSDGMSDDEITQHCQCGNDTYHVKTTEARDEVWAECTDCGRPTGVLGDGMDRQRRWRARHS